MHPTGASDWLNGGTLEVREYCPLKNDGNWLEDSGPYVDLTARAIR